MSTRKVVNLEDFADTLGDFANISLEKKKKAVVSGIARSIPDLVAASPVDTGLYAASWDFTVEEKAVVIGNYAPYAGIIEHGARPFKPPLPPLLAWAKRVLTGSSSTDHKTGAKKKLRDTGQPETDYTPEVWALAIHTQRKIMEHGMQPRHILENAIPTILENIRQELKSVV